MIGRIDQKRTSCCTLGRPTDSFEISPYYPLNSSLEDADIVALDLVAIPGGHTHVGTSKSVISGDGETPKRKVKLKSYKIGATTVTNNQFAAFVRATGYVTEAERIGNAGVFRGLLRDKHIEAPSKPAFPWGAIINEASWRAPEGPKSALDGRGDHPVVQISQKDAMAYCKWAGGRLPSEAEWEYAARGALPDPRFPWGDDEPSDNKVFCNIWQGRFPDQNTELDGYYGTAPVRSFEPNGYGLYNMVGNVWEWTSEQFRVRSLSRGAKVRNAQAAKENQIIIKGGSFLCHVSYCYRYRIVARHPLEFSSAMSNVGFRIAL